MSPSRSVSFAFTPSPKIPVDQGRWGYWEVQMEDAFPGGWRVCQTIAWVQLKPFSPLSSLFLSR